jgi:hypothetical protein
MKRASGVVCASVFLLFAFAQSASADASCGVFVEGNASDVFGNTVWSGSSLVDAGIQPDAATCSTAAYNALNSQAYSICAQRSSGVNLDLSGGVYFNEVLVQEHQGPSSCVAGFGLNAYTALGSGAVLNPTNSITSPNGWYTLVYQADGNIVVYQGSTVVWAGNCWSTCSNWGAAGVARMQGDGNFVVINASGDMVWMSATVSSGAFLALRDDGQIAIYSTNGTRLWSSVHGHSAAARRRTARDLGTR